MREGGEKEGGGIGDIGVMAMWGGGRRRFSQAAVKSGCLRSSEEVGLSSGFTSRHRIVKSLRAGLENSGIGGGAVA